MDYLVQGCGRVDLNGVYFHRAGDVWVVGAGGEEGGTQIVKLDDRWVFTVAGGGVAMRSVAQAPDVTQCEWEAFMPEMGGWVDCAARILPIERGVTITCDKTRVNGVYLLAGEVNGMPRWELASGGVLYYNKVWVVSESASHVARGKGVLKSAATSGLPYQTSLEWWASNTAARGWVAARVSVAPVPQPAQGGGAAALWHNAVQAQQKIAEMETALRQHVAAKAPDALYVTTAEYPALQGVYLRDREQGRKNGLPVWTKAPGRAAGRGSTLYADGKGYWCLSNAGETHYGRDTCLLRAAAPHEGAAPHEVAAWLNKRGAAAQGVAVKALDPAADRDLIVHPPPTPSDASTVTEIEAHDELCAHEWAPSEDAVRCRLFVFFQRAGYKLARETPAAEDIIQAIRLQRTTLDEVMASLCAKANEPVQPWLSPQSQAVAEYIINALHVRYNNFGALASVALAAKAVCTGQVHFTQYIIQLCRQYGAVPEDWVGDFPAAVRPLPEDERLAAFMEDELGIPASDAALRTLSNLRSASSHTASVRKSAPSVTLANLSSSRAGTSAHAVSALRKSAPHTLPQVPEGASSVAETTVTNEVDARLDKLALLEGLRETRLQQEALAHDGITHLRALVHGAAQPPDSAAAAQAAELQELKASVKAMQQQQQAFQEQTLALLAAQRAPPPPAPPAAPVVLHYPQISPQRVRPPLGHVDAAVDPLAYAAPLQEPPIYAHAPPTPAAHLHAMSYPPAPAGAARGGSHASGMTVGTPETARGAPVKGLYTPPLPLPGDAGGAAHRPAPPVMRRTVSPPFPGYAAHPPAG